MPGPKIAAVRREQYLQAVDLWREHPLLGFVDALTAAIVPHSDHLLATFDSGFEALNSIRYWHPDNGRGGETLPEGG